MLRSLLKIHYSTVASTPISSPVGWKLRRSAGTTDTRRYSSIPVADTGKHLEAANEKLQQLLRSPTRYQPIAEREDRSDVPISVIHNICQGKYISNYRGAMLLKNPQEVVIYHQLFSLVKPQTVIELGTFSGASAVWFADTATALDYDCHVYTLDIDPGLISEEIKKINHKNVTFIEGDSGKIEEVFPPSMLQQLPHPWLVVEDAHHNSINVLKYLDSFMTAGDYIVVEDTDPRTPYKIGMNVMYTEEESPQSGPGKLNMMKSFLKVHGQHYLVDSFFTDFYGYNCTWHWHGFLRRMQ